MHQAHATAEDEAVHQRQYGFAVVVNGQVEGIFLDEEVLVQGVALLEAVVQRADVAAGAKGFLTGAAQYHGVDLGVVGPGLQMRG
ncbi:hypothetical protein PFLmoz3_04144 [Pseudomonas fluorescens]|uniref:Uncharacterized protein n=1 Tax=Pseudomonas fluorescens TaxID=294 RepID=A0A120G6T0_PSEFL|nr:hypothetical protein PFLmoz3_04144 [Pseudomonas fluorescens]